MTSQLLPFLLVAAGSAVGGCMRFAIGSALAQWAAAQSTGFPFATFAVNVAGSFAIGAIAASVESMAWRQFLMIGLCGGFTTFSSFSFETLTLLRNGQTSLAAAYVAGSALLCVMCTWAGERMVFALR